MNFLKVSNFILFYFLPLVAVYFFVDFLNFMYINFNGFVKRYNLVLFANSLFLYMIFQNLCT